MGKLRVRQADQKSATCGVIPAEAGIHACLLDAGLRRHDAYIRKFA
ncbi:MAG: hypothetical protein PHW43_10250 [Syntrophales bacterium]|nr:hypothetical protein [Syntrophales bacterium]